MPQDSADIPQADKLEDVVRVVEAVNQGKTSYQDIADAIGKVGRQGRYYRRAAENLGFIEKGRNAAKLLPKGVELLQARSVGPLAEQEFLRQRVLAIPVVRAAFDYIEKHPGATNADLSQMLNDDFGLAKQTMSDRRAPSIVSWLKQLNLITGKKAYVVVGQTATSAVDAGSDTSVKDDELDEAFEEANAEPGDVSRPNAPALRELTYIWSGERKGAASLPEDAVTGAKQLAEEAEEEKDQEDAASVRHQALVEHMASWLRSRGLEPQYNEYIDLYAEIDGSSYLCEMKSCRQDNFVEQARRGLAQLYEYRYLHQLENTRLVLVLETEPIGPNRWYMDYLIQDRGILVCWETLQGGFGVPPACAEALSKLVTTN